MLLNLLILGFALSLDNFRTAVILGPLRFRWRRALEIAAVFGLFDGLAPLIGILLGHDLSQAIGGGIADNVGAAAIGLYGLYLIVRAWHTGTQEELEKEHSWSIFGLPIPLSLDNVVAGTGLGLLGLSPLVPAALFGTITFVMTLAGLQLGRVISRFVPIRIRCDLLVGVALVIEAVVFGLWALSGAQTRVMAWPTRTLAGQAVSRPDTGRLARDGEHRYDPGAGSPEAALESGHLRRLLPAGHLRVRIEPAEHAEHHTQMRVCPAQGGFDAMKLTSLTVVEAHFMLFF